MSYYKGHRRGTGEQRVIHWSGIAGFLTAEEEGSKGALKRTSEKFLGTGSNRKILHKWLKEKPHFWRTQKQLEKDGRIKRYKTCLFNNNKKSIKRLLHLPQPQGYSYLITQNLPRLFRWYSTWSVIPLLCTCLHQTDTHLEDLFGILPKSEASCIFHRASVIKFVGACSRTSTLRNRT